MIIIQNNIIIITNFTLLNNSILLNRFEVELTLVQQSKSGKLNALYQCNSKESKADDFKSG